MCRATLLAKLKTFNLIMKSGRLLLFKTETINVTNLFLFCLYKSSTNLYKPSAPKNNGWYLDIDAGGFIYEIVENLSEFRNVCWADKIDKINNILLTGKDLNIGNFDLSKLQFIKESIPGSKIISVNYDVSLYELMLKHFVLTHLHRQGTGIVKISELDQQIRDSGIDPVSHYMQVFDEQQLVPQCLPAVGDYSIPVTDFFNFEKFFAHYKNVDTIPSPAAIDYYNSWQQAWAHTYGDMK